MLLLRPKLENFSVIHAIPTSPVHHVSTKDQSFHQLVLQLELTPFIREENSMTICVTSSQGSVQISRYLGKGWIHLGLHFSMAWGFHMEKCLLSIFCICTCNNEHEGMLSRDQADAGQIYRSMETQYISYVLCWWILFVFLYTCGQSICWPGQMGQHETRNFGLSKQTPPCPGQHCRYITTRNVSTYDVYGMTFHQKVTKSISL